MADFDVSLRFGIDYRRDGAREIVRDIETLKRAAERLGRDATGRGFGDGLDKAAKSAEKARQEVDKLAQSDDRLRQANGTEALSRNVQRLAGTFERTEQRAADLRAAVDRLKTAEGAAVLTGDIRRIEQVSEASRRKLDALRGAAAQLGDTAGAKDLREAIDRLSGTADKSETAIKGIGDAVRQLGRENGVDTLRQDLDQAETSARRVEDRLHRVERAGQRLGGGGRSRFAGGGRDFAEEAFDQSGATAILPFLRGPAVAAGAVAGGVVYGAFGAGRQAMQLETAMASVRRQAPKGANLSALESGIVKLSVDMGVPKEEIAALVANAMKTNVAYGDLLPFAQNAAQFAVAGEMSMGEAGGTLSLLRDQFKIKQGQVPELLDRVNYLADKSSTNEKDVLNFMARASSSVDIANLKPEQFAAIGTTFLNVGTAPEVAGTGFNALMGALGNAGDKSRKNKDFRRALSKLGLNGRDLQERFYGDTAGTILDFFWV